MNHEASSEHAGGTLTAVAGSRRGGLARWIRGAFARLAIVGGILLFFFVYLLPDIMITVQSGEVGVLYRRLAGGTETERVIGEGLAFVAPWDKLFIYTIRVQEAKHTMTVLTNDGLTVTLQLSIRYHPERDLVALLHQQVGPEYKERIVLPEVESVVRTTMSHFGMDQVYGADRGVLQRIITDSLDEVSQKYVEIDDVIVRSVELPASINSIIEQKMTQKERAATYAYRLEAERKEAERKEIEANGFKRYNDILASSITPQLLQWRGLDVTKELALSPNAKMLFLGNNDKDLPLLLNQPK